jgi:membrane protease subunit HflC
MKSPMQIVSLGVLVVGLLLAQSSLFVVNQSQQAMVLRFGKPVDIISEPGLKTKMPLLDNVEYYDKRLIVFNAEPMTVILKDQDRLMVDAFVTYRITDPLKFYQAVRSERVMDLRLESILEKSLRDVLGQETLATLLSPRRDDIMLNISNKVSRMASGSSEEAIKAGVANKNGFGIEVKDVRIMRTDLPKETSDPIYNRMRSDRQKVAEKFRAEGRRESQIIRSDADKERTIMIAEADKKAEEIRGQGDGEASSIYAKAFSQDPEFYAFYRSMQAYRKTMSKDDTTVILSPKDAFLKNFSQ